MSYFNMSKSAYGAYVKEMSPSSTLAGDLLRAFAVGGAICCVGQALFEVYTGAGMAQELAATLVSVTLVFLGALLTGIGVYDDLAKIGGAGTLVPITGFANSVVSPAIDFKSEGFITGMASKMFVVAGPVIVIGTLASVVYGVVLMLL